MASTSQLTANSTPEDYGADDAHHTEGPAEAMPVWRTRRTHTQDEMMSVYREIFFAGFPCSTAAARGGGGGRGRTPTFPKAYVENFFGHYGTVEYLNYDEERGMGSVTYSTGDAAEHCYLAVHLSLLPPPGTDPTRWEAGKGAGGQSDLLLCLEFAQCCPFVNTLLLRRDELRPDEVSRRMMRTFPMLERTFSPVTSTHPVVRWEAAVDDSSNKASSETKEKKEEEKEKDGDTNNNNSVKKEKTAPALRRIGPCYPSGEVHPASLGDALWRLLAPEHIPASPGNFVTVLDLWWEYYQQYFVKKTEPSASRIRDPAFAFAQRPSMIQEIHQAQQKIDAQLSGGVRPDRSPESLITRLVRDDAYHSICSYICYQQQFRLDPTWASVMRDIFTDKVNTSIQKYKSEHLSSQDRVEQHMQSSLHQFAAEAVGSSSEAEEAWLRMTILTAAANVIDNVRFLQKCERGLIDKDGQERELSLQEHHKRQNHAAMGMTQRQSDEELYMHVLQAFDNYAMSGSADSLLSLCEDPEDFRSGPGHIGSDCVEQCHASRWRAVLQALWVPLLFLAFVIAIILVANLMPSDRSNAGTGDL